MLERILQSFSKIDDLTRYSTERNRLRGFIKQNMIAKRNIEDECEVLSRFFRKTEYMTPNIAPMEPTKNNSGFIPPPPPLSSTQHLTGDKGDIKPNITEVTTNEIRKVREILERY